MLPKILLAAATTAAALTFSASVRAEVLPSGYDQYSATVRIGDLNLNSDDGARRALARISTAASQVCGEVGNNMDLGHRRMYRGCVGATVQHALTELDSSRVNGVYATVATITLAAHLGR